MGLTLPTAGPYRAFADFAPNTDEPRTLGMDLTAAGDHRPVPLPPPATTTTVDGLDVVLTGEMHAGRASELSFTISQGGQPVTDLDPYLGAYGHLVAIRPGDLAYLHVHPTGEPGDGHTTAGPDLRFSVHTPSPGTYRLFLDFSRQGAARTAAFTADVSSEAPEATEPQHGQEHH